MRELEDRRPPGSIHHGDEPLAFAVFCLAHAPCGAVVEKRLGEGRILGFCPSCGALRTFAFANEG